MESTVQIVPRYEFKYRLPAERVADVRRALRTYCDPDPWSLAGSYLISSLYLDSPRRLLYRQTRERRPKRWKLRVRRYATGAYFLESKHREGRVLRKQRTRIEAAHWPGVLLDAGSPPEFGLAPAEEHRLGDFVARCLLIQAEPAVVVRYRREAYVSRVDHYGRATIDGHIEAMPPRGWDVPVDGDGWLAFDDPARMGMPVSATILELKCSTGVPDWMSDLVVRFGLRPLGFSKYACAVETVNAFVRQRAGDRVPRASRSVA